MVYFNHVFSKFLGDFFNFLPPPRCPSGRVLPSSAGGPGFNPASYQRRYKNGTSSSLV